MKIPFIKISNQPLPFEIKSGELVFFGNLNKKNSVLVYCEANIVGKTPHNCDRCGNDIILELDENINILLSNGIYTQKENELDDVVEFFNGEIDLDEIFVSETETYKSDYFYCEKCKNL